MKWFERLRCGLEVVVVLMLAWAVISYRDYKRGFERVMERNAELHEELRDERAKYTTMVLEASRR